jgi:DNA-binding response OmpR family regulator
MTMTIISPDNSSAAILVIEDSRVQAMRLKLVLEQNGYYVHWADTGQTGLAAARARPFDLIVLDVELPDKSGFDICCDFKADPALADVPVIMLTKRDHAKDAMAGLETGAIDYIPKDVFADTVLLETIKQMNL